MESNSQLWTDTFFPKTLQEFVGNSEAVQTSLNWAESWKEGKPQKPLFLAGATGTGKTALAHIVANVMGWELFEMNASDLRNKDSVERVAGTASQNASFSGKPRLVLIDEVDGLQGRQDRGGVGAISQVIKSAQNPIILTANDPYDQKIKNLRFICNLTEFKKINYLSIAKRLREILESQNIKYDPEAIKLLAQNSHGDFRSALLDTQSLASEPITIEAVNTIGERDRQEKVFKVLGDIFKGNNVKEINKILWRSEISTDLLTKWIEENIPRHFTEPRDTAAAFDVFSRSDIFNGRIFRRQHYGFLRYSSLLATSGVALSRSNEYPGWISYQFPKLLSKLSSSKPQREVKKSLALKIGKITRASAKQTMASELPYLMQVAENKKLITPLAANLELNEKEIAYLLKTKPETKKVQKILAEAAEINAERLSKKRSLFTEAIEEAQIEGQSTSETNREKQQQPPTPEAPSPKEGQTTLF